MWTTSTTQVWPLLVDYFYRDSITITQHNVCPLLALSRQLLVTPVCHFCTEFIGQHLTTANCISYLRQAERYHLHDIQQQAVALAAQGDEGVELVGVGGVEVVALVKKHIVLGVEWMQLKAVVAQ